jgi:hypothetical protein
MPDNNNGSKSGLSWSQPSQPAKETATKPVAPASKQTPLMPQTKATGAKTAVTTAVPTYAGLIVGGIIVGVLVAWGWNAMDKKPVSSSTATTTTQGSTVTINSTSTISSPTIGSDTSFAVANPQDAGTSVALGTVNISVPTWFVVYESRNGAAGNILGAALLFPDQKSATIELLRGTQSNQQYFVAKRADNGDRRFELEVDDPVRAEGSDSVLVEFRTR